MFSLKMTARNGAALYVDANGRLVADKRKAARFPRREAFAKAFALSASRLLPPAAVNGELDLVAA